MPPKVKSWVNSRAVGWSSRCVVSFLFFFFSDDWFRILCGCRCRCGYGFFFLWLADFIFLLAALSPPDDYYMSFLFVGYVSGRIVWWPKGTVQELDRNVSLTYWVCHPVIERFSGVVSICGLLGERSDYLCVQFSAPPDGTVSRHLCVLCCSLECDVLSYRCLSARFN